MKKEKLLDPNAYFQVLKGLISKNTPSHKKISLFLIIAGLLWTIITTLIIIPSIAGGFSVDAGFYSGFPCVELIPRKILYFVTASLTLGFLPFIKFKYGILLTFLPWLEILGSCQINMFRIGFQYPYMLLPLSMIAIIYSLREIPEKYIKRLLVIGVTIGLSISLITTPVLALKSPLKEGLLVPPFYYQPPTEHHEQLVNITKTLSETNFSILTQNDIFPHLANRKKTYVIWSSHCDQNLPRTDAILFDWKLLYSIYNYFVENYSNEYTKLYEYDGIELWIRKDKINHEETLKLLKELKGMKRTT